MPSLVIIEHLPGLRTDACQLCSRHQRPPRRLTLCKGCPEAVRRVHLELHVCPPAAPVVVPVGQLGLGFTTTAPAALALAGHLATCTTCVLDQAGDVARPCPVGAGLVGEGA